MGRSTCLLFLFLFIDCAYPNRLSEAQRRQVCASSDCFTVGALPPAWRALHRRESEIAFFDDAIHAVIQGNQTCRSDAEAAPLSTLTHHLLIGYTDRRVRSNESVMLDRREALRTVVDARLDGVEVVLDLYVLKRNGCIYDLSLAAPPRTYSIAKRDFAGFVEGFAGTKHL